MRIRSELAERIIINTMLVNGYVGRVTVYRRAKWNRRTVFEF